MDDEIELMTALCDLLANQGFEAEGFASGTEALAALRDRDFDLLLSDLMMPEMDGVALLKAGLEIDPHLTGIIMTGQGTVETAVEAMKVGAFDYVLKPFKLNAVLPVISRALEVRRLRMENLQLRETAAVHELTKAIALTLDLNTILDRVADAVLQQCEADEVSLMLPTGNEDELCIAAVRGESRQSLLGDRRALDRGIAAWVARHRESLTLHGDVNDPRFAPFRPRADIRSAISMPMLAGSKLVGVLNVNAIHRHRPFTLGEVKAMAVLISIAAPAMDNASLYAQARETEEKYRSIFENSVEGIYQSTLHGRFIAANPAMSRMLGYDSPEELQAAVTNIEQQFYVEPRRRSEFRRLLSEQGNVFGFEYQVRRKDGSVIWVSENARPLREANGQLVGYEGTMIDITERKRACETLLQQQKPAALRLVCALAGAVFTAELGIMLAFHFLLQPLPYLIESCLDSVLLLAVLFPILYFFAFRPMVLLQITERRRAEESRSQLTDILEATTDYVATGSAEGRAFYCNRAGRKMLGIGEEEDISNLRVPDVYPEWASGTILDEGIPTAIREGVWSGETALLSREGREIPVSQVILAHKAGDGTVEYLSTIARDITERKKAEKALAHRTALAEFAAEIGTALTQAGSLQTTLLRCTEIMVERLEAAFARIWTLNEAEQMLELQASAGMYTHRDGAHSRVPVGKFKIGAIAQERQPHLTNEVIGDPRVGDQEWAKREGMVAFAGYPLIIDDRLVGVVAMFARHTLAPTTLQVLGSAADTIALFIQRKQAEEALLKQLERTSLLNSIARSIAERHDLDSILHATLAHLDEHLPLDSSRVNLYSAEAQTLTVAAVGPKNRALAEEVGVAEGMTIALDDSPFRPCIGGETVHLPDLTQAVQEIPRRLAAGGMRSMVCVPLALQENSIGVLCAIRAQEGGFSQGEIEFLQTVGEHVALATHQAQLHQDLQKAYDELTHTQQAIIEQERLRALGQMASGIAHDFNNSLSPIAGFSDLMLMRPEILDDTAQVKRYLEIINTSAKDAGKVVSRMREFYRHREQTEVFLPVDLNGLVKQVIPLTQPKWKDQALADGRTISIETDLQDLPAIAGNESELREVLTNLVFNAVDAMPEGGVVSIRTRVEERERRREGESVHPFTHSPIHPLSHSPTHVLLEVSDTGTGMTEEVRERCLIPFFTTKEDKGTGLGLSMVYGIIQRHEGTVDIESEWGKGTTFILRLPVWKERGPDLEEEIKPEALATRSLHILLVDDEPNVREVTRAILTHLGHTVETATNGREGLQKFRAGRFDLVVTDRSMPDMNGDQLAAAVKQIDPNRPVIMVTGFGEFMQVAEEHPVGVDSLVGKPITINGLEQAIAKVMEGRREEKE